MKEQPPFGKFSNQDWSAYWEKATMANQLAFYEWAIRLPASKKGEMLDDLLEKIPDKSVLTDHNASQELVAFWDVEKRGDDIYDMISEIRNLLDGDSLSKNATQFTFDAVRAIHTLTKTLSGISDRNDVPQTGTESEVWVRGVISLFGMSPETVEHLAMIDKYRDEWRSLSAKQKLEVDEFFKRRKEGCEKGTC